MKHLKWRDVVLGTGALVAAAALAPLGAAAAPALIDPASIPKYQAPLKVPGAMPKIPQAGNFDYYEIAIRQVDQQMLPAANFPATKIWAYGAPSDPATFTSPSPSIEATVGTPVRVKWINQLLKDPAACAVSPAPLTDPACNYLPHLFAVDQTLLWANPNMECVDGTVSTDCRGKSQIPYTGPVPFVTHMHGVHAGSESDGTQDAWYLPAANDIPAGYAVRGRDFGQIANVPLEPGAAVFQYPNNQAATGLWFHDHANGLTRLSVYAGAVGLYNLRGGDLDMPAGTLPSGAYEVPIVIQDRSFNADGSLFYPDNRAFFEGLEPAQLQIPFIPDAADGGASDVSPIWNPEVFGNTMVVNGQTWPYLEVEAKRYRLRFLNGSNARFLILKNDNGLPFWQIGSDGGFLPKNAVRLKELLIAPAERADVIVDFGSLKPGTTVTLLNIGPDEPYGGGKPGKDFDVANPETTGQVMQFRVKAPLVKKDPTRKAAALKLPQPPALPEATFTRPLSLNELESSTVKVVQLPDGSIVHDPADPLAVPFGPAMARFGTFDKATGLPTALSAMAPVTEKPVLGTTEIWEFHNFTADAHPVHVHLVQFEVLNRQGLVIDPVTGAATPEKKKPRKPEPWEAGRKDTVIAYPGEVTRIKATFDVEGMFLWHCHILEHEDNEMMRNFEVVAPTPEI